MLAAQRLPEGVSRATIDLDVRALRVYVRVWSPSLIALQAKSSQYMFTSSIIQAMPTTSNDNVRYRVPKLAVRNRAPETSSSDSCKTQGSHHQEYANAYRMRSGSDETAVHPALRDPYRAEPRQIEQIGAQQEKSASKVSGKRKSGGVLGFLTLKEPSTSALEEFAENERRRMTAQKGSKMLSGVSTQKLPSNVPKVNSKWNGLPESTQRRTTGKESSPRHSQVSLASRHSGHSESSQTRSGRPRLESSTGRSQSRRSNERSRDSLASSSKDQVNFASLPATPPELVQSGSANAADDLSTPEDSPRTPSSDIKVSNTGCVPALSLEYNQQKGSTAQTSQLCVPGVPVITSRHQVLSPPVSIVHSPQDRSTKPALQKADEVLPWEAFEPMEKSAAQTTQPSIPVPEGKRSRGFSKKLGFR